MNENDDDVEHGNSNTPFYKQLLLRMNPTECISPTMANVAQSSIVTAVKGCTSTAYTTCLASDREEFESVLQQLLKDIKFKVKSSAPPTISKSNARTAALQRLYRLTDREHAHNRYAKFISGLALFIIVVAGSHFPLNLLSYLLGFSCYNPKVCQLYVRRHLRRQKYSCPVYIKMYQ